MKIGLYDAVFHPEAACDAQKFVAPQNFELFPTTKILRFDFRAKRGENFNITFARSAEKNLKALLFLAEEGRAPPGIQHLSWRVGRAAGGEEEEGHWT